MKSIIRAMGFATALIGAASWLDARATRRRARRRDQERIEKARWESEGGATPSGAHITETNPGLAAARSGGINGMPGSA